jgi:AcrR family transcriptional regulator
MNELRHPLADLPAQARYIVETTRRLLTAEGYRALSLERIAKECRLNKTAIRYYFGNKAGLMELVIETFVYDSCRRALSFSSELSGRPALQRFLEAKREVSENEELSLAFFEFLPNILREPQYRARFIAMYELTIAEYMKFLDGHMPGAPRETARTVAQLLISVLDGLCVQYSIDPQRFPIDRVYTVLESMLACWLESSAWTTEELTAKT